MDCSGELVAEPIDVEMSARPFDEVQPPADDLSFFGGVADFSQEVVKQNFLANNESLLDDDIASALLNGINNKSALNDSVAGTNGNQSQLPNLSFGSNSFLNQSLLQPRAVQVRIDETVQNELSYIAEDN